MICQRMFKKIGSYKVTCQNQKNFVQDVLQKKITTELNIFPNDTLSCPLGHWIGKEVKGKLVEIFDCPRCALENIKTELKTHQIIT